MNLRRFAAIIAVLAGLYQPAQVLAATTLLPNGMQCFTNANGALSTGSVSMFIPGTSTPKNTWQDSGQAALNTNPINLNANGCAVIYGIGSYRQVVYDGPNATGTQIYDQLTTDTSAYNSVFWAGLSGGTPNAITITDSGFNSTDGAIIQFVALNTNTAATTLNVSSTGAISIQKDTASGPTALAAGDIVANNIITVTYYASSNSFHIIGGLSSGTVTASTTPQGYLTLLAAGSGGPIQTGDIAAATTVYYSPFIGNQIPIYNGVAFTSYSFAELSLTLTASWTASSIYDVCVFSNSGVPTLVTGPAWTTSTAGAGARGTGAGTTQITRLSGIWTNAVAITGSNGTNTYAVPVNQCTYVGSIAIDGTNGQVSSYVTYGQNRKRGVWNAYNGQPITMKAGDPTATWTYNSTWQQLNNASGNTIQAFTGLSQETISVLFEQAAVATGGGAVQSQIGIGWNVVNAASGFAPIATTAISGVQTVKQNLVASYVNTAMPIGINNVNMLQQGSGGTTQYSGTEALCVMTVNYRG